MSAQSIATNKEYFKVMKFLQEICSTKFSCLQWGCNLHTCKFGIFSDSADLCIKSQKLEL